MTLPDLRHGAQGHLGDRLDRRHPQGPGRGLRAARARAAPGSIAETRKLDEVNESIDEVLQGRTSARLVLEF